MRENPCLPSLIIVLLFLAACQSSSPGTGAPGPQTDRDRDGLRGPVRAALTEDVILPDPNSPFEGQIATSVSIYEESGRRTLETPYRIALPAGHAITRHETYFNPAKAANPPLVERTAGLLVEYDIHGNLVRQRTDEAPDRQSELSIRYEYDAMGNWIRRTLSRSAGANAPPQREASYRHLIYFNQSPAEAAEAGPVRAGATTGKGALAYDEDAARTLFNQRCVVCHGEDGKGKTELAAALAPPPRDLTESKLSLEAVLAYLGQTPAAGRVHGLGGRLPEDRLQLLALHARRLSQGTAGGAQLARATPTPTAAPAVAERRYALKGKIVSIELDLRQVAVEHEEIVGYMEAMTMPFPLPDEAMLRRLKKGDRIEATLLVDRSGWRLQNVVIK
ncbi:MAG: copper-binding protein [Blastocatellia bacterium]|nr:copper-binding protein [Blastocatellia bacterium]